jgi:O-antigen/teichoic acid export membrane protein
MVLGCAVTTALWFVCRQLAGADPALADAIMTMAWFLPAAAVMMVGLAATRGLGGVRPYVLVSSIAVPTARPMLVLAAAALSAGTVGAALAWAGPFAVAALAACWVLYRSLRTWEGDARGSLLPGHDLRGQIRRYSLPRSVAILLEQMMLWIDVLLVGLIAGPAAAGIYGAATRFVAAGRVLSTAFRIVVAPTYSRLLGRDRLPEVQSLYTTTTQWIVLFSTPVYVLYALFGGTILSALGGEFREGAQALAILSVGLTVSLLGGNVQVLLLMGGHSGRTAVNKAVTLVVLVVGIVSLTPAFGITGAATAWTVSMTVDLALAAWRVSRRVGVKVGGTPVLTALAVGVGATGLPALTSRLVVGDTLPGLLLGVAGGGAAFLAVTFALRRRLAVAEISSVLRRRNA